jgi:hypothetical protein
MDFFNGNSKIKHFVGIGLKEALLSDRYFDIKIEEDSNYQYITAQTWFEGHKFRIWIWNDIDGTTIYLSVICLWPLPEKYFISALKLLNEMNGEEKEAKYRISIDDYNLICTTFHSIVDRDSSGCIPWTHIECSMENLITTLRDIVYNNTDGMVNTGSDEK